MPEYTQIIPFKTLFMDGGSPGIVEEIDANGMIWVRIYKWGYSSPDTVHTWVEPLDLVGNIVGEDFWFFKRYGLPPTYKR